MESNDVMLPAQRNHIRKLLLALQEQLSGKGPRRIEPNRTSEAEVGGDEDEQPLNEMMQAIASNRNRNQEAILERVDKALRKLDEEPEDFGACETCGEDVGLGRLKVMPYAELCVGCQGKQDSPRARHTRKRLTDFES